MNSCPGGPASAELPDGLTAFCFWTGTDVFGDGDAELGQRIGPHPDPHRILARTKDIHHGNAGHAQEGLGL